MGSVVKMRMGVVIGDWGGIGGGDGGGVSMG